MVGEIDACKVVPGNQTAYDEGKKIGKHALDSGNVQEALTDLSRYTQTLFASLPKNLTGPEKQQQLKAAQQDLLAGVACADPRDFQLETVNKPGGVTETRLVKKPDVSTPVNSIFDMFDRFNKHPRLNRPDPGTSLDYTV